MEWPTCTVAMTVPAFRRRGVYLSLVANRLAVSRIDGCIASLLHAHAGTSAPILIKREFLPVCRLEDLARKRTPYASSHL